MSLLRWCLPFALGVFIFIVYLPSLKSDFVYDAYIEIEQEGYITCLSNIASVLSLKVLGLNIMLGSRPGQLLYLMLIAGICGKQPFGYHLCSNFIHGVNVILLFLLLRRLVANVTKETIAVPLLKVEFVLMTVSLIYGLHPLMVESVAEISYSSSLLVTLFTLLSLLVSTYFNPKNLIQAIITGVLGSFFAFGAVLTKESGITAAFALLAYWYLFHRKEPRKPWAFFLGSAMILSVGFLLARFSFAPPNPHPLTYLGGSFFHAVQLQPRLWVFMIEKLFWPMQLSADYTPQNIAGLSVFASDVMFVLIFLFQIWLALKGRIAAFGVILYWLGLATVSNLVPLYRIVADRYYYLPMVGLAMQLIEVLLFMLPHRSYLFSMIILVVSIPPLFRLNLDRQKVFSTQLSLWSGTLAISPFSAVAHNGLGLIYFQDKAIDTAIREYQTALTISPNFVEARNNLGLALYQKGLMEDAIAEFQEVLQLDLSNFPAYNNLATILFRQGMPDKAIVLYRKALAINPRYLDAHVNLAEVLFDVGSFNDSLAQYHEALNLNPNNLEINNEEGTVYLKQGRINEAVQSYQHTLAIDPDNIEALTRLGRIYFQEGQVDKELVNFQKVVQFGHETLEIHNDMGISFSEKGRTDDAILQFKAALRLDDDNAEVHNNLANALLEKGRIDEAIREYHQAEIINPNFSEARNNLGLIFLKNGEVEKAIAEFKEAVRLSPGDKEIEDNLAKAKSASSIIKR